MKACRTFVARHVSIAVVLVAGCSGLLYTSWTAAYAAWPPCATAPLCNQVCRNSQFWVYTALDNQGAKFLACIAFVNPAGVCFGDATNPHMCGLTTKATGGDCTGKVTSTKFVAYVQPNDGTNLECGLDGVFNGNGSVATSCGTNAVFANPRYDIYQCAKGKGG
jgi:hypothetical protein